MGVPAFYKWLSNRYPKIYEIPKEELPEVDATGIPVWKNLSEPNKQWSDQDHEFDNLYIDMNGLIHPCFHPEDAPTPESEKDVYREIFAYIDRLFALIRPRRLVYMAIDGVAPRAKMNQQRHRRYTAAWEKVQKVAVQNPTTLEGVRECLGFEVPNGSSIDDLSVGDSNVITPGTPFMDRLAFALRLYIEQRQATVPAWSSIDVVLSDSSVPGEGEHKVMEYIRRARTESSEDYSPNMHHVLCGLDADLIFLGLVSHEVRFSILREIVFDTGMKCSKCGQHGHALTSCPEVVFRNLQKPIVYYSSFQLTHLSRVRRYLQLELNDLPSSSAINQRFMKMGSSARVSSTQMFEHVIDDFAFLCFLCGNDFLPHLPSLSLRDNGLLTIFKAYRAWMRNNLFITRRGVFNLGALQAIMNALSHLEAPYFRQKHQNEMRRQRHSRFKPISNDYGSSTTLEEEKMEAHRLKAIRDAYNHIISSATQLSHPSLDDKGIPLLSKTLTFDEDGIPAGIEAVESIPSYSEENEAQAFCIKAAYYTEDKVYFHKEGYRYRYYKEKLGIDVNTSQGAEIVRHMVIEYIRGLAWVLQYYVNGCPDWSWYYPYHYAPLASDFVSVLHWFGQQHPNVKRNVFAFCKDGRPFKPFEQLMAVLPAVTAKTVLPDSYYAFMVSKDSPIFHFYPHEMVMDMNGATAPWLAVTLLPFIEQNLLLSCAQAAEKVLSDDERRRNTHGNPVIFLGPRSQGFHLYKRSSHGPETRIHGLTILEERHLSDTEKVDRFEVRSLFPDLHNQSVILNVMHKRVDGFEYSLLPGARVESHEEITHINFASINQRQKLGIPGAPPFQRGRGRGRGGFRGSRGSRGSYRGRNMEPQRFRSK